MRRTMVLVSLLVVAAAVGSATVAAQADRTATGPQECSFPVTETDGTDTPVSVEEEPATVVTLNPSAAQTMWEIGARDKVIGVTKHAMNLEGAENRTNVSRAGDTINPEAVVELDPDLVLAPSSKLVTEELVTVFREAGLTVYYFPSATSIADVRSDTLLTGRLVGECDGARETVQWMDHEIDVVESAVEGEERPTVLYTFFGYTAGGGTFIHEIIEAAGGTNIAAEVGIDQYQPVNEEMVVEQDPEWIVLNSESPSVPASDAFNVTTAVQEDQVVVVNINYLNRPGPRIVHGISTLAEAFHPEAYANAVAKANATDDAVPEKTPTDGNPPGQAGFGVGVAIAGLLLAVFAVRRTDGAP